MLSDLGHDGICYLRHALRDPRTAWRQYGAEALGFTGRLDAMRPLAAALGGEPAPVVRVEIVKAVRALASVRSPGAGGDPDLVAIVLEAARRDPDPGVRAAAQ